ARRAADGSDSQRLGHELWDWGIPTAVTTAVCSAHSLEVIASGGIRNGYDVARALALGARCAGMAAPVLRAQRSGGFVEAVAFLDGLLSTLTTVLMLTGSRRPQELSTAPRHLGPALASWLNDVPTAERA